MAESDFDSVDRTSKPLYLKNNDLRGSLKKQITDFDLIDPIKKVIGDEILCVQIDRNLWRIYLKSTECRHKLLTQGIDINSVAYQFYDTNPYTSGATSVSQKTLKLRICGLPLSVADSAVQELLNKLDVKLTSKILYEKIRHPETNRMTSILNGTRFMYIEPLPDGKYLPRINYCGGIQCKLFHYGKPKKDIHLLCTNCWKTDHTRSNCSFETCCKVCKQPGHSPGNEACPHYQPQKHLTPFSGAEDVLSNFYPCVLDIFGIKYKSAEHAFQYIKAVRCSDLDSANIIKDADDALSALRIGKKIKPNEQWVSTKEAVMEEILENKCVQGPVFRDKLCTSKQSTVFVETTYNNEWGSGLDRDGTCNTKPEQWPGKNILGVLMKKIARKVRKRKLSDSAKSERKQKQKDLPKQKTIPQMLNQLREMSDSDEPDTESSGDDTCK
ncbi:uncharacterized protein LOC134248578 [Saccostrea cucullata]|uniref:uncharacterized protein LOC134248578 n=1 Tax=Saccostrea cuccullata TaxID=36930 RepID=UPI002ED5E817